MRWIDADLSGCAVRHRSQRESLRPYIEDSLSQALLPLVLYLLNQTLGFERVPIIPLLDSEPLRVRFKHDLQVSVIASSEGNFFFFALYKLRSGVACRSQTGCIYPLSSLERSGLPRPQRKILPFSLQRRYRI
jgi:hypothetical protein